MTLGFSTTWPAKMGELAGTPTYFIDKIWAGLLDNGVSLFATVDYYEDYKKKFGKGWDYLPRPAIDHHVKIHTIREDRPNRWREGMDMHFAIKNQTKDRFQFAPVVKCTGVQCMEIVYDYDLPIVYFGSRIFYAKLPSGDIGEEDMLQLAQNDGFPTIEAFFSWFDKDFSGKIIHWTDKRY